MYTGEKSVYLVLRRVWIYNIATGLSFFPDYGERLDWSRCLPTLDCTRNGNV